MNQASGPKIRRILSGLVLCCILILAPARVNAAETRVTLARSVGTIRPQVAATKRALAASDLADKLDFSVALKLRDFEGLKVRVARGETFSRAELEERYLPLKADYEAVKAWAKTQGLEVTQEDTSRLSVFVRGTVSQIQSSLQVSMVKVTSEGLDYPAADSLPSLPESIAAPVLGVNGLHPYRHLHKHVIMQPQDTGITYTVPEILTTYDGLNLGVTGAGQTIAILIDATPRASDLTTFWTNNGIAQSLDNIATINVNNTYINATEGEETLDVEWSSGIAPGAKIRIYATGTLDDASLDKGFARIVSDVAGDPTIHQLSISLGLGETYETDTSQFTTDGQYFAVLASQGVSTFVSSGDGGSTPDATASGNRDTGPLQVEYYASDPSVTGVGGTTLNVDSSYARTSETAWTGSGGGVSMEYVLPSWQTGAGVPAGTRRFVPDVCMPADPYTGAYVWLNGTEQTIGGTSWSTPTWAGFCALFNQARANAGMTGGIGLLNPSIYPLIGTGNFTDITSGSNAEGTNAGGNYNAAAGYDRVTGIGAPDVKVLMNTLAAGTTAVAPPTITGVTPASGPVGTVVTITGTNLGNVETVGFYSPIDNTGAATITSNTATQVVTTVPAAAQTGPLTVTIPGGVAVSSVSFTVTTTTGTPTITGFTPTSGKAGVYNTAAGTVTNGTAVTITGTNFTGAKNVTFNGISGSEYYTTPFTVGSSTTITTYVPVGATTGYITVTTANGNAVSTGVFTVTAATGTATITSFAPTSGAVGASVVITGTTFTGAKGVNFGTVAAKTFTVNSTTKITATVPVGAVTGPIGVTNTKGGAASTGTFTVTTNTPAPTITGFNPASGPVGTSAVITGTNLTGATAVSFHGTAAGSYTVNSATQITVAVPTGATTGTISVTTPGGTATSTGAFTVTVPAPTITGFSPTSGAVGTSVTLTGTNFTGATAVSFNGTAATNFTVSSAMQIIVSVPTGATTGAISVTTPGGTVMSMGSFTVTVPIPAPAITGFDPTSGPVGTNVTITGTSLTGATAVSFNGAAATSYTVNSDTQIVATVPAGAATGAISVTTPGGTAASTTAFTVTVPTPDLTIAPAHVGNFMQTDAADTYTITVGNVGNGATTGTVSVTDTLPGGLTATAISGSGWTCDPGTLICTRSDSLPAGSTYPVIMLTVAVSRNAACSVTNMATVSGGGETNTANDSATDPTPITALTPHQGWRYDYFGTTANSGNVADTANPSGDGLSNLIKYGLGLNPLLLELNPITQDTAGGSLRLTIPKNPGATDLTYTVQVSSDPEDPTSWTADGTTVEQNTSTLLVVHDNTSIGAVSRRFLRLQISY